MVASQFKARPRVLKRARRFSVDHYLDISFGDDVEAVSGVALAEDVTSRRKSDPLELGGDLLERGFGKPREDRHTAKHFELAFRRSVITVDCKESAPEERGERRQKKAARDEPGA